MATVEDEHDWSTEEIVRRSLDRYRIEKQFRASKSSHVRVHPFFHWTGSKIRCHLLSCVIALVALRMIERSVNGSGRKEPLSGGTIIDEMRRLRCVWAWYPGKAGPERIIEAPTKTQADVLRAFGYRVGDGGVLQDA